MVSSLSHDGVLGEDPYPGLQRATFQINSRGGRGTAWQLCLCKLPDVSVLSLMLRTNGFDVNSEDMLIFLKKGSVLSKCLT